MTLLVLEVLLSPTRAIADRLKMKWDAAAFIHSWSLGFLAFALGISALVYVLSLQSTSRRLPFWLILIFVWLVPFSRVNEVFYAFLHDSLDRIRGRPPTIPLQVADRIILAGRSYLETIINFGLIHYLVFSSDFSRSFRDILEAVYFSGVTITTLGYGDLTPCGALPQMLSIYEVLIGYVLVVVALGAYLGGPKT